MRAGSSPVSGTNRNYSVEALSNGRFVGLFYLKETFLISVEFRISAIEVEILFTSTRFRTCYIHKITT